jgi:hypothetical protein
MERKYVRRRLVAVILFLGLWWFAMEATTPKECKVSVSEMSQFCKELRFP